MTTTTDIETLDDLRTALLAIRYSEMGYPVPDTVHPGLGILARTGDFSDLPTFGGETPSDTRGIWSWDATGLLVGEGRDDWQIVARAHWFARD